MAVSGYIFNIQRFSVHDGPGIRTTVFLKGCPLRCWWCHNPEGLRFGQDEKAIPGIGSVYTVDKLFDELNKDLIFYEESRGGVTFSGGEPLAQIEFLSGILDACKSAGIHSAIDTSGYANKSFIKKIKDKTDLFLFDLKLMDPVQHLKFTEVSNTDILENLDYLLNNNVSVAIRIPLIPDITATIENIEAMKDFLNKYDNKPTIYLLPFHRIAAGKYDKFGLKNRMNGSRDLTKEEINDSISIFSNSGFNVKTGG